MSELSEPIRAGDLRMVGGAICLVPEACERCGAPAAVFEGRRALDPGRSRIAGLCPACAERDAAERAWYRGLTAEQQARYSEVLYDRDYYAMADNVRGLSQAERANYGREYARLTTWLREFTLATGAPAWKVPAVPESA